MRPRSRFVHTKAPFILALCYLLAAAPACAQDSDRRDDRGGAAQGTASAATQAVPAAPAVGEALRVGEYACYGSGGQILIGLGFKVLAGGRTTDLDGGNPGTYVIEGDRVLFHGGHLDGQIGRNLKGGSFQIGAMANCEPW